MGSTTNGSGMTGGAFGAWMARWWPVLIPVITLIFVLGAYYGRAEMQNLIWELKLVPMQERIGILEEGQRALVQGQKDAADDRAVLQRKTDVILYRLGVDPDTIDP